MEKMTEIANPMKNKMIVHWKNMCILDGRLHNFSFYSHIYIIWSYIIEVIQGGDSAITKRESSVMSFGVFLFI